jgi:hypothetical protein
MNTNAKTHQLFKASFDMCFELFDYIVIINMCHSKSSNGKQ